MKGHLARVAIIASLHLVSANYQQEPEEVVFDWSSWWSYDGISGPGFWGIINRRWRLCSDGRRQSPVDLATAAVVYDHTLSRLDLASHKIDGTLSNTGFGLRWTANAGQTWGVTGGPLHYAHTLTHAVLRWSNASPATSTVGSEHSIEGQFFPAEDCSVVFHTSCPFFTLPPNYSPISSPPSSSTSPSPSLPTSPPPYPPPSPPTFPPFPIPSSISSSTSLSKVSSLSHSPFNSLTSFLPLTPPNPLPLPGPLLSFSSAIPLHLLSLTCSYNSHHSSLSLFLFSPFPMRVVSFSLSPLPLPLPLSLPSLLLLTLHNLCTPLTSIPHHLPQSPTVIASRLSLSLSLSPYSLSLLDLT
ncbi:putative carbonic anhydrase-related protein 10 [Penaeus vannamei]|uniref:Putative carbonic anhydrase-related protein 10 n=1 Tax=Penaeus vannamei TaxID=6689 RepID=A0A3R7SR48_PENVA|nr:putative carbonic anhydrase-related protein 10 [Penaeus vannamei]